MHNDNTVWTTMDHTNYGLYILPSIISSYLFFNYEQSYVNIYWTYFHDLFTRWMVFAWILLIRSSFSDSLRDVAMATNFVCVFYGQIYFVVLRFGKGLQYRNSNFKRLDRLNISRLCTILVTFGRETSEFTLLTIAPFVAIRQKSAYHAKYLRISWTYLDLLYRFGRCISEDDFTNIRLTVAQWTLL